ncbi:bifunctional UDP-N-acetylglucosamine diphosphorylase/glucosamine-1-phosphate N-acetyltransferase GlmU [Ephemeroptericola cinctiostellae]|uniref:bifunctional UDP-N-acetylglucosamine diphosphorylase/glucosamine-1-phosphate N-acetyltransferase GlmU n=1 Tax=Ephemeroptericola cinctiostellae TaxID=2268024 RepID=UPI000DF8241F|nr:bifunctional UDP-N-acetylglucosamine diphosphorylase/glucosamine-1-phosphate N-acetyltransferase GlmU [Ephemeroptericola cinctiostellae]
MNIVVLAAGKGTRMRSKLPKVLHVLAGESLLARVLSTARDLGSKNLCVVVGHGAEQVRAATSATDVHFVEQMPQLGTGHALQLAASHLNDAYPTLVLYGDVPLTQLSTLQKLVDAAVNGMALLTVNLNDPTGYGRIVRDEAGAVQRIVEHKDASDDERSIQEVNTGVLIAPTAELKVWLSQLSNDNVQGEYYLTDVIGMAVCDGVLVNTAQPAAEWETLGVNSKAQLAELETIWRSETAKGLLEAGVTLADPTRIDVRGSLKCGMDVSIDVGCVFEGHVTLGDDVRVGPYCVIRNSTIAAGAQIAAFSHIDGAVVGEASKVGPYARLRPDAVLAEKTHIGNFVEIKKATVGVGSKVNHLSYIGDATIGNGVNVGAGVITCNYDGVNKFQTVIGDGAFIGSDSQLVAPVTVGAGATIGAGSTITKDTPEHTLTLSRAKQMSVSAWVRPVKK